MSGENPSFKKPSKKHKPYGLTVLYEDRDIIVVNKINGLLTVSTDKEKSKTAFSLLNDYVRKGNSRSKNRVYIVHRLDRDTSGVLVFAKTEIAKQYLQDNWKHFNKIYYAVVHGRLEEKQGIVQSYLMENKAHKVYSTKDEAKGKLSKTGFKVIKANKNLSLLEIELYTGRKNQIRVHLSEKGHPVIGDKAYGPGDNAKQLALHAAKLTITHPYSKKEMFFETAFPVYFKTLLRL